MPSVDDLDEQINDDGPSPPRVPFGKLMSFGSVIALVVYLGYQHWGGSSTPAPATNTNTASTSSAPSSSSSTQAPPHKETHWSIKGHWLDRTPVWDHDPTRVQSDSRESPLYPFAHQNETNAGDPNNRQNNPAIVTQPHPFYGDNFCAYEWYARIHPTRCPVDRESGI